VLRITTRCFLPIHVYDTARSRPVAVVLRPGKTPSGVEVRAHLRRLVRRIRRRWAKARILFRGDGHYARPEAMSWCEDIGVDDVFGLPGSKPSWGRPGFVGSARYALSRPCAAAGLGARRRWEFDALSLAQAVIAKIFCDNAFDLVAVEIGHGKMRVSADAAIWKMDDLGPNILDVF